MSFAPLGKKASGIIGAYDPGTDGALLGTGITSLGGLTDAAQTLARVNDTNVTLGIGSAGGVHTFTVGWTGTLADERIASAATWNAKEPPIPAGTTAQYLRGDKTWQTLNKAAVGLSDVDNTSDMAKPVSTAQQAAIDAAVVGLWDFKGSTDCSSEPNYPAALKGDTYVVSVAGKIGGASGIVVSVGDIILALADNAGGTQAAVGTSWVVLEANIPGITTVGNALLTLANPSAIRFIRINADNTVTALSAGDFLTAIGGQAGDADLTDLAGLNKTGNALKIIRVKNDETGYELATGGGDALTANPLSQFAATTSAELAGVLSDETGTGVVVYSDSPALTGTPTAPTAAGGTNTTQVSTTAFVVAEIGSLALLKANNLSDLANAGTARTNLGMSANGSSLVTAANYAAMRGLLDLEAGTDFYSIAAADALLAAKAPLASPTFTGTPAAPTPAGGTNTTQIATTAFVLAEVAAAVTGLLDFKGNIDCATNPDYPAASKGDVYMCGLPGKIGGASGKSVDVGDAIVANQDGAGGDEAAVGSRWFVLEHNLAGVMLSANNLSDLTNAGTARTNLGLSANGSSLVTAANYAAMRALLDLEAGTDFLALAAAAPLASPTFTGTPAAPTAATGTSTTQLATTAFVAAQIAASAVTLNMMRGVLWGLTISNNATDPTNDIDIAVGAGADHSNAAVLVLGSTLVKRLDAAWAVGTNQGGLDTGTIADTTYHVWLIRRSDTGVVDALFSTSASAPTMPTNYDQKCRIGSIIRSGAAILPFIQYGDYFYLKDPILDIDATDPGTSAVTRTLTVITGIKVGAILSVLVVSPTGSSQCYLSSLELTDMQASLTVAPLLTQNGNSAFWGAAGLIVWTNTSGQIRSRLNVSGGGKVLRIATLGWIDNRGKDGQ